MSRENIQESFRKDKAKPEIQNFYSKFLCNGFVINFPFGANRKLEPM